MRQRITVLARFILQRAERKDYGTDCEIEVVEQEQATSVRVHAQLKGTERPLNADGSLSIEVSRTNLNYLLMHPHSFYAAYHVPTESLHICLAETFSASTSTRERTGPTNNRPPSISLKT